MAAPKEILNIKLPDGNEAKAEPVDIKKTKREEWNEYELIDGKRLKLKTIVTKVFKLVDIRDPTTGEARYIVQSQNIAKVE